MTIPDSHRDLLDTQVGVLGTIGPSGRPQLSALWFLAEGDTVKLSLNTSRQKTKNLIANPKCSLIITGNPPSRYIELRGDAEIEPDDNYEFADKVGAKYGADLRNMDKPGDKRVVVTIRPARVITWDSTARS
ncbi:MAG: PPOX class F420-dependent oxidoreductase [Streptosporangiales bacterium]|nr:PPOX class F420-dependent oxidoreductase [Streptosporangiales bacterium]